MNYGNFSSPVVSWDSYMQQNEIVKNWASSMRVKLKASAAQFKKGKKGTIVRKSKSGAERNEEKLIDSIKHRVYYAHGIAEGVGFRIERHGVFVHKGVGRGYKMVNGMVIRYATGPMINGGRKPVDWFNSIVDQDTEKLANDLAQVNADASVNAMRMRIN